MDWPSEVLAHARARPATLGAGRLVCIDGLAGSGKTTLARAIVAQAPGAVLVSTDDMLEGWRGLAGLGASVDALLRPLAAGRTGHWRQWDWRADSWGELVSVEPPELLVLEGVGSASGPYADLVTTLVWVEAERGTRLARGLARDGEQERGHWLTWLDDEEALHARVGTRDRADLVRRT